MTGDNRELHVSPSGEYTHAVLANAFQMTDPPAWKLSTKPCLAKHWPLVQRLDVAGALINQHSRHWVCIAKHNDALFFCDSCQFPLTLLTEADFGAILKKYPNAFMVLNHEKDEDTFIT